jgi:hypothetical protein
MTTDLASLSGTFVVGEFRGISTGDYPQLQVRVNRPGGDVSIRKLDFRGYDSRTGHPTAVGDALDKGTVVVGDRVAVGVWLDTRTRKDGTAFPVMEATSLHPLGA